MFHQVLGPIAATIFLLVGLSSSADARWHGRSHYSVGLEKPCVSPPVCCHDVVVVSPATYSSSNAYYGSFYSTHVQSRVYHTEPYSNYVNWQSYQASGFGYHPYSNRMSSYSNYYPGYVYGR